MAKPRRTIPELQEAIMHLVRRHPEWNDILSVTITKRTQADLQQPISIKRRASGMEFIVMGPGRRKLSN